MDLRKTPDRHHQQHMISEVTPKNYADELKKLGKTFGSLKDSGIGSTYLAVSSGSSSNNTSPESEKDALQQNGKGNGGLKFAPGDATSTPTAAAHSRDAETTLTKKNDIGKPPVLIPIQDKFGFPDPEQVNVTPLADRKRFRNETFKTTTATLRNDFSTAVLCQSVENKEPAMPVLEAIAEMQTEPRQRRQRRMHACEHCGKEFDRPSLLKRHTLTHTGERPFECRFCSKGFSTRSGVNTHERTHTGQRPYVCRICGRRFAAGSNLIFHKYTHSNTRRHQCSVCPKAFVTPGDLRKHAYIHTGEWPFRCSLCERGFATERNLKSHEVTHSGKKPFSCPLCSKSYAQESSMKTHMRTHQTTNSKNAKPRPTSVVNKAPIEQHSSDSANPRLPSLPSEIPMPVNGNSMGHHYTNAPRQSPSAHFTLHNTFLRNSDQIQSPQAEIQSTSAFSVPQPRQRLQANLDNPIPNQTPEALEQFLQRYKEYYFLYLQALMGDFNRPPVENPQQVINPFPTVQNILPFAPFLGAQMPRFPIGYPQVPVPPIPPQMLANGLGIPVPPVPQPFNQVIPSIAPTIPVVSSQANQQPAHCNQEATNPRNDERQNRDGQICALDFSLSRKQN